MQLNKYLTLSLLAAGLSVTTAGLAVDNDATTKESKSQALFEKLDADGDGKLTAAELAQMPQIMRQRHFDRIDADGNGEIDQEEYRAWLTQRAERRFKRLDKNDDGMLSVDELSPTGHHRGGKHHARQHHHKGRHGHRGRMRGTSHMFAHMDADNDGYVTAEEWDKAWQKMRSKHRHHKRGDKAEN